MTEGKDSTGHLSHCHSPRTERPRHLQQDQHAQPWPQLEPGRSCCRLCNLGQAKWPGAGPEARAQLEPTPHTVHSMSVQHGGGTLW